MKILLVKMSSMGDLIHTLPALTDAMQQDSQLTIDWVVEPAFADIPSWHPAVRKIILLPLRQWRKNIFSAIFSGQIKKFLKQLREEKYDLIIDAQGLLKSAITARLAHGKIVGFSKHSARDSFSSYFYHKKCVVKWESHAVFRIRTLFAFALNYTLPTTRPNFNIDFKKLPSLDFETPEKYIVLLHGTTWESKHYPESYWRVLVEKANEKNVTVFLSWGNPIEKARAERLMENMPYARLLPKLSITEIATFLKNAKVVVAGDTGLGHLSAALTTPSIGIYGPTDPERVGIVGDNQFHFTAQFPCAPCYSRTCWYGRKHNTSIFPTCYSTVPPEHIWAVVERFI